MGSEALAKQARRDIRRAFAPEASEEVLKFVAGIRQDIAFDKATQHNINMRNDEVHTELSERFDKVDERTGYLFRFTRMTFGQRLRWLLTGRFL